MAHSESSESKTAIMGNGSDPPHVSREGIAEIKDGNADASKEVKNDGEEKKIVEEVGEIEIKCLEDSKAVIDKGTEVISNKENSVEKIENGEGEKDERNIRKDEEENYVVGEVKDGEENKIVGETEDVDRNFGERKDGIVEELREEVKSDDRINALEVGKDGEENEYEDDTEKLGEKLTTEARGDEIGMDLKINGEKKDVEEGKDYKNGNNDESLNDSKDKKCIEAMNDDKQHTFFEEKKDEESVVGQLEGDDAGEAAKADENTEIQEIEDMQKKETIDKKDEEKVNIKEVENQKDMEQVSIKEVQREEDDAKDTDDVEKDNDGGGRHKTVGEQIAVKSLKRKRGARQRTSKRNVKESAKGDVEKEEAVDVKDGGKGRTGVEEEEEDEIEETDDVEDEHDGGDIEMKDGDEMENSVKRDRGRAERTVNEGETKEKGNGKEKKENEKKAKDLWISPVAFSKERPVRERKTVERLVEVIEKEPNRAVIIEKGRGTSLKDIPNVAYKLARKKPTDLKLLHQTLFGRKGKAVDFKSNLLQFSGFAWHESEGKQRAKIKEKFDKCAKDALLDLCDLFDLTVSRTNTRKEEIIVKLLDFMEAPHAVTDVILSEEQSAKSRKRKKGNQGSASKGSGGMPTKKSTKKSVKAEGTPNSIGKYSHDTGDEDDNGEEDDTENNVPDEDDLPRHTESDTKEIESEEEGDDSASEDDRDELEKRKQIRKKSPKHQSPAVSDKRKIGNNSKKEASQTATKSPVKTPSSKNSKVEKSDNAGEKHFSRKKKDTVISKRSNSNSNSKDNCPGKKTSKEKSSSAEERKSGPSKTDLRNSICQILKEVDFNTATFTDILTRLATHYQMDLTPRKPAIKLMIQEELTKMADEADDSEDEGEEEKAGKHETPKLAGKKVKA